MSLISHLVHLSHQEVLSAKNGTCTKIVGRLLCAQKELIGFYSYPTFVDVNDIIYNIYKKIMHLM